jgi:proline dehydrogenase
LYRKDMLENLKKAVSSAKEQNYLLGAKLVRGAYMEKESERAAELNYENPIQNDKIATDNDFNEALRFCLENLNTVAVCVGSHNEHSNYLLTQLMKEKGLVVNDDRIYSAQLYGMGNHISYSLAHYQYNVAKYVPYGPVEKVMPYLFRRAEENTSVAGQTSRELSLIKKEIKRRKGQRA